MNAAGLGTVIRSAADKAGINDSHRRGGPVGSITTGWLASYTDEEVAEVAKNAAELYLSQAPGTLVNAKTLDEALKMGGADFEVQMHKASAHVTLRDGGETFEGHFPFDTHGATVRIDRNDAGEITNIQALAPVGEKSYGIVQTSDAKIALDALIRGGKAIPTSVEVIDGGKRVRTTAFLGETKLNQQGGDVVDVLGHFAVFEATHDGSASITARLYTIRLACLNGMTSMELAERHTLAHRSNAADKVEEFAEKILQTLMEEAEAEMAIFQTMVDRAMSRAEFEAFAAEFLGEPDEDATKTRKTRFEKQYQELLEYFDGGNQGAGATTWGAYNSVTRWLEAKHERLEDAKKAAKKWGSTFEGDGAKKRARALKMLTRY